MSDNKDETKKDGREFEPEDFPLSKSEPESMILGDDITPDFLTVTAEQLLASVKERLRRIEIDFAYLGRDLFMIDQHKSFSTILDERGKQRYSDFAAYWAGEFGQPIKNAYKLINIYKKYVKECGIDLDTLKAVGVTKAQTMFSVVNKTNARELVEKATTLRVPEFRKEVAKLRPRPHRVIDVSLSTTFNPPAPRPEMSNKVEKSYNAFDPLDVPDPDTIRVVEFYLFPEQEELVNRVIYTMKQELGTNKDGHALTTILQDYEAKRQLLEKKSEARQLTLLSNYEKVYGGKVLWLKNDEIAGKVLKVIEESGLGEEIVYERD